MWPWRSIGQTNNTLNLASEQHHDDDCIDGDGNIAVVARRLSTVATIISVVVTMFIFKFAIVLSIANV